MSIIMGGKHRAATDAEVDKAQIILLHQEVLRLRKAIKETLEENAHLADGENCTLLKLKRAIADK